VSAVSAPLLDATGEPAAVMILVGTFPADQVPHHGASVATAAGAMNRLLLPFLAAGD
jgi:hypothetical protein